MNRNRLRPVLFGAVLIALTFGTVLLARAFSYHFSTAKYAAINARTEEKLRKDRQRSDEELEIKMKAARVEVEQKKRQIQKSTDEILAVFRKWDEEYEARKADER
jgi:7-keto-8-aminopelargonate synthetase-like enzyme